MRLFLPLLALGLCACAGMARGAGLDPASYAIRLTDLGAGVIPTAINNAGQVAGQAGGQAFRWENGVFTPLGTLGGAESYANDLNDSGVVVGWAHDAAGLKKSFRWDGAMTNLDESTTLEGVAEGINNLGEIVGWRTNGNVYRSVMWDEIRINGQFIFGSSNHKALGINDSSEVIGITLFSNGEPDEGFYWNGIDSPSSFTDEIGSSYFPYAGINNNGLTAGEVSSGIESGAHYLVLGHRSSTHIDLLSTNDTFSTSLGLNDQDLIVGQSGMAPFIYELTSHSLFNVNDFNANNHQFESVLRLNDINNSNAFVGVALIAGVEHGVYGELVPIPEPASALLGALAAAAFMSSFRLRRVRSGYLAATPRSDSHQVPRL